MKIRLHKNSVRLRLSQTEVAELKKNNSIEERFDFSNASFVVSLQSGAANTAHLDNKKIRIVADLAEWIDSDREGIDFTDGLKVAIEKDFQCLHRSSPEDADSFPNPMMDKF
jgi:uncharacterized protein DUF7009